MAATRHIVAADIGGTHARFAIAAIADGRIAELGPTTTFRTADHASFEAAWRAFAAGVDEALPTEAAIAVAAPVGHGAVTLTNNRWVIDPAELRAQLGVERMSLINDLGAVAHAVAQVAANQLPHVCGPDVMLPDRGVISIVGPGTGLGVAALVRTAADDIVIETEGGHAGLAPCDAIEDAILARLRAQYGRVSVERLVSGPGLVAIHKTLAALEGREVRADLDERALWSAAAEGSDPLAVAALDRFCHFLGGVAGDIALIQGAAGVVIAGGVGLRLREILPRSGFAMRFRAKGRFEDRMRATPVKLLVHPAPGLLGAATAHAAAHA